jgi:hypothetical protein
MRFECSVSWSPSSALSKNDVWARDPRKAARGDFGPFLAASVAGCTHGGAEVTGARECVGVIHGRSASSTLTGDGAKSSRGGVAHHALHRVGDQLLRARPAECRPAHRLPQSLAGLDWVLAAAADMPVPSD